MKAVFSASVSFFAAILSTIVVVSAQGAIQDEFNALKNSGKNYEVIGTICEEVARLQMARHYQQPAYTVVTGIAYGDRNRTIGELDVVVFENRTAMVVKVAEVKCWKDMRGGLAKAHDQRNRFIRTKNSKQWLFYRSTSDNTQYDQRQFQAVNDFVAVAQRGATQVGYEGELQYTLEELMGLRHMMIQCQARGECH